MYTEVNKSRCAIWGSHVGMHGVFPLGTSKKKIILQS